METGTRASPDWCGLTSRRKQAGPGHCGEQSHAAMIEPESRNDERSARDTSLGCAPGGPTDQLPINYRRERDMVDLGEHIEEMAKLYKENGLPRDPASIAQDVLDIACDQGLLTEAEASSELAHKQVTEQASYLLGVD